MKSIELQLVGFWRDINEVEKCSYSFGTGAWISEKTAHRGKYVLNDIQKSINLNLSNAEMMDLLKDAENSLESITPEIILKLQ